VVERIAGRRDPRHAFDKSSRHCENHRHANGNLRRVVPYSADAAVLGGCCSGDLSGSAKGGCESSPVEADVGG